MPLQYKSAVEEVKAVRTYAGVFDLSHMGRLYVEGKEAFGILQKLTTNNLKKLKPFRVQYNLILNQEGGIKDDVTLYMFSEEKFFLCVNAVNRQKIKNWLNKHITVKDVTNETVQIAVQGRESVSVLSEFFDLSDIKYYTFKVFNNTIVSRTGYTGEDGFEIYTDIKRGIKLFTYLVKRIQPCGLAARDILRIEAGYPLYGKEISETITPIEANLEKFIDTSKDFIGKEALFKKRYNHKLFGLEIEEKGIPREGYEIFKGERAVGVVTSGTFSPTLGKGIALCFVETEERKEGNEVYLKVRNKLLKAKLRSYPFVKKSKPSAD